MFAMVELEQHLIVQRLADGIAKKHEAMKNKVRTAKKTKTRLAYGDLTQKGRPKSCGAHSTLQDIGTLSSLQKQKIIKVIQEHKNGILGWRSA